MFICLIYPPARLRCAWCIRRIQ